MSVSVAAFATDPQCVKALVGGGGGYLCLDELSMHALRGDSTRGGSPRSGHESQGGPRCVGMGRRMGWTRIIVCHGAYVISSVQTHIVCCLTCFLHGVVMQGCVAPTRCGYGCVTPTGCEHGCLTRTRCRTLTRCGTSTRCRHWCVTLTKCGRPTRCMTLTRLTTSLPLMSTCLPTTPYSRLTCVGHIACIVQG